MKLAIVFVTLAAFAAAELPQFDIPEYNTAYGYLTRFGIAEAERIQAREEEYLKNPESRIFNGQFASLGQFPYQAGLVITLSSNRAVCGAVLVKPDRLLTAAHCWFDGVNRAIMFEVVLGSITLFTGGTRIETNNVLMHPRWSPRNVRNDIAVVSLPSPVPISDVISPIALPSGSQINDLLVGETATISGFGARGNNLGISSNQQLSHATVNIISNLLCSLSYPTIIQSSHVCIRTSGSASTCGGDSGGPLTVQRNGAPLLSGLTSFGPHPNIGGCEAGRPAAFARVSSFMSWINQHI